MRSGKTKDMILCAMFTVLIAAGAFIKIPVPVVPFTLQYLFTMLAGLLLGAKRGFLSVFVYMLLGLAGLPIFAQGGGIGYIFQPSFGYIIGFAVGAFVTGAIAGRTSHPGYKRLLVADFAGLSVVYLLGMVYYYLLSNYYLDNPIGLWPLFLYCFLLAVPGDILLCIVGAVLGKRLIPLVKEGKMQG
ncbi:MAG: biotin transporter BioY [Lachnospiraceae bacterium]|nr:biotin transporter BioY [Lachnospiraceae bacterium]